MYKSKLKCASPYLLLLALFVSDIGLGITQMYTMIWVYEQTKSNFFLSLHACVLFGSSALGALVYTLKIFRKDLLVLMIISKILMALFLVCLAYYLSLFSLYCLLALFYISSSIFIPSAQALLSFLIESDEIQKWNGNYFISYNLSLCLGWFSGPLVFPILDYKGLLLLDAFLSFICIVFLLLIHCSRLHARVSYFTDDSFLLNEAPSLPVTYSQKISINYVLISFGLVSLVFSVINSLEMGIFSEIYRIGERGIACFFIAWVIGGVMASCIEKKSNVENFERLFIYSNYLFPVFSSALIIPGYLVLSYVAYSICGFLYGVSQLLSNFFIYAYCAPSEYAAAFNRKNLIANVCFLISSPIIGFSADRFSITSALLTTCFVSFLLLFVIKSGSTNRSTVV